MFDQRLKNVKQLLKSKKMDAVFISSVSHITYLTGFSGFSKDEREAYLLIGQDFEYIITDGRYSEAVKKDVPHLKLFERGYKNTTETLLKKLKNKIKNLGIEEDNLTIREHKKLKKHFKNIKHIDIKNNRSIKSLEEIKKIEKACRIGDKTFKHILKKIKSGITEKELAFEIEFFVRKQGAEISFPIIVAFGANSSVPHHQTGSTRLENNKFVLIDMGVKFENYCSDMTRTVFFGKPSKKQINIYQTVLDAQQKAVDFINKQIKSGKQIKAPDVDKMSRDYIISKGYPTIPHSLGHGIGLEVHENPHLSPKSREILKEGMVFSIEPGIYIPGFGSPRGEAGGVRIEDLFVLEKNNLRQLTTSQKSLIRI